MRKSSKPKALVPGCAIAVIAPASPAKQDRIETGCRNLERLGYRVRRGTRKRKPAGYFSASATERLKELQDALSDTEVRAIFCTRGGYGAAELLDGLRLRRGLRPKIFCGFSDLTSLHIFLWQRLGWVTFYGPLVAGGLDAGANATRGYDPETFTHTMTATTGSWSVGLKGETLARGVASGVLLGGCLTLLDTSIGTSWELDTRGSILLLEDRGMKPYQIDRTLLHLKQAGKFKGVRGIILGDFPECDSPDASGVSVKDVCRRILGALKIPMVYGVPIGHTLRPMFTLPLGVRARMVASGEGNLEILEAAVSA